MPDDDRPLLQFVTAEPVGYGDPVTGLCEVPAPTPEDEQPAADVETEPKPL